MMRGSSAGRRRKSEAGYNLVEVLIAMAILAIVLLSVVTLFVMGQRNVYSGKQLTVATSVATRVLEDLSSMRKENIWDAFALDANEPLVSVDVDTTRTVAYDTYADAILRTTTYIDTTNTDPDGYLQRWRNAIHNDFKLGQGEVHIVLQPREPSLVSGSIVQTAVTTGSIIKIRVIVRWVEGLRVRQVIMDTVKFER